MKRGILLVIMFAVLACGCVSAVDGLNVSLSDQGSGVKNSTGSVLASGDLYVSIWDNLTGGNLIYNESFSSAIINGSWSVMLGENGSNNLTLQFGNKYYKDYVIAGEDADFTDYTGATVERQFFFSPLGEIADADISDRTNLTLSQKITFALAETIDNIVNGWITVTGGLIVSNGLNVTEAVTIGSNLSIGGLENPNITVYNNENFTFDVGGNRSILTREGDLYLNNTLYTTGINDHGAGSFEFDIGGTTFTFDNGGTVSATALDAGTLSLPWGQNMSVKNSSSDIISTFTSEGNVYVNNTVYFGGGGSISESGGTVTMMIGTTAITFDTNGIISPGSGSTIKAQQWDYNEGNMTIRNVSQSTNILFTDAGKFLFGLNNQNPRVGIGVATPSADIDSANLVINGTMRLMAKTQPAGCGASNAGEIYYNSSSNRFYGCDGTSFKMFNMSG